MISTQTSLGVQLCPNCVPGLPFVLRGFAANALCGNLWFGCALLAEWPDRGLCAQKTHGAGARGLGESGEGWLRGQAP